MNINWIKTLKVIGFVASGIISYMLMATLCKTYFDYILAFAMTLVLQASSFYFFDKAVKQKERRGLSSTLAILLFSISIIGTVSFQFRIQNNAKNEMILESSGYKQAQKTQQRKEELIELKKDEIKSIDNDLDLGLASIDSDIFILKQEIEMWKAKETPTLKYYGQINRVNKEIADLEKEKREIRVKFADKKQLQNENLEKLYYDANEIAPVSSTNIEIEATKGYLPLLQTFSRWLNIDLSILTLIFQSFIACVFECTAIYLHIEDVSSNKKVKPNPPEIKLPAQKELVRPNPTHKKYKIKTQPKTLPVVQPIGFKSDMPSETDIKKYMDSMENPATKGYCRGYKKISEITGLKQETCRTIKGMLERRGTIKTIGTKTKIIG